MSTVTPVRVGARPGGRQAQEPGRVNWWEDKQKGGRPPPLEGLSSRLLKRPICFVGALSRTLNVARSRSPGSPDPLTSPPARLAKRSTPRVRPSGAASHLDLFERPAELFRIPPGPVEVGARSELAGGGALNILTEVYG